MDLINNKEYIAQIMELARLIPMKDCIMLVTGATGLVGTCLVDSIIASNSHFNNNIKLVLLGRNSKELQARFKYDNSEKYINYVEKDLSENTELISISAGIDYIIHLASLADPRSYTKYPVETIRTNINGTQCLLEYCKKNKKTRLLFTSSFEVYGKIGNKEVYHELDSGEIDLNGIRSCYPVSKKCSEIMMRAYHEEYNVDCVIARLCSVYGPTMKNDDSKAHAQFINAALNNEPIIMKSEGLQKRSYCYVMDVVSALFYILFNGVSGEAYNVSNEESITTIKNLANMISRLSDESVVQLDDEEIDKIHYSRPHNCVLDNKKLKDIGWKGKYSLNEGIKSTIEIMRGYDK